MTMAHFVSGLTAAFALALLAGCGEPVAPVDEHAPGGHGQVTVPVEEELRADDGRKWTVSPHMMVPIRRMQERLAAVDAGAWETPEAARVLADSLFRDMDELVRVCDMKGEAHDVLHEWLMPHMMLLQRLEKAPNADSARHILEELHRSNALFHQRFE